MRINAKILMKELDNIHTLGASKIESSNLIMRRNPSTSFIDLAVTSRITHLLVYTNTNVAQDDELFGNGAISVNRSTFASIINEMGSLNITIVVNPANTGFMSISSEFEHYELAFTSLSPVDEANIFEVDTTSTSTLFSNCCIRELRPVSNMIGNISMLCVDQQFKTIIHRKGRELTSVFVTGTTLSSYTITLPENTQHASDDEFGIDTKTHNVPRSLATVINCAKIDDIISMYYNSTDIYIIGTNMMFRTSYETKATNISDSIQAYHNMSASIQQACGSTITMKINGEALAGMIRKSAALVAKSTAGKLTSYVPLYVVSPTEVKILFKCSSGAYNSSISSNVEVDGLPDNYTPSSFIFNMSIVMMSSILDTLNATFSSSRVVFNLKDSGDGKIYVQIYSELSDRLIYYMRLRR